MSDKNSKDSTSSTPETNAAQQASDANTVAPQPAESSQTKEPSVQGADSRHKADSVNNVATTKTGRGLAVFSILLSLLAIAAAAFTWYQTQVLQVRQESQLSVGVSEIGGQISRLGDAMSRLQSDQADVVAKSELASQLLGLKTDLESQDQLLLTQQTQLQDAFESMAADLNKGVRDFAIEEVSQLLRLANNSLLFASDSGSAERALVLADNQLKGLNDPRFGPVRVLINEELALLRNMPIVDIAQLSASLAGIAEKIPSLPLENEPEAFTETAETTTSSDVDMSFSGQLRQVWEDILGAVTIQRVDQPPKPLLAPEQRYFLNQNIQLALSKAELAALQKQPALYSKSLTSASAWLRDYFDLSDPQVGDVLRQLDGLREQTIQTEMPDISRSYQALQSIIGRP